MNSEVKKVVLTGTPVEVGAQIFHRFCIPAIREASNKAPPEQLAQLYVGFLSAAFGSMAADFGHELALDGAQSTVNTFANMAEAFDGVRIQ